MEVNEGFMQRVEKEMLFLEVREKWMSRQNLLKLANTFEPLLVENSSTGPAITHT